MSIKYKVIQKETARMLERSVECYIKKGYKPVGSMSVSSTSNFLGLWNESIYCQAVIKED